MPRDAYWAVVEGWEGSKKIPIPKAKLMEKKKGLYELYKTGDPARLLIACFDSKMYCIHPGSKLQWHSEIIFPSIVSKNKGSDF